MVSFFRFSEVDTLLSKEGHVLYLCVVILKKKKKKRKKEPSSPSKFLFPFKIKRCSCRLGSVVR